MHMHITVLLALTMVAATMVPLSMASPGAYDDYQDVEGPVRQHSKDGPPPGGIPVLGGAFFDVTSWNAEAGAAASYGRHVRINVEQMSGQVLGGFAAFACTDYNDDLECDSGSFGFSDDDCSSGKDTKDCADPTNLEVNFCAERDDYDYLLLHGYGAITEERDDEYDDFIVIIMSWTDIADDDAGGHGLFDNENDNTGAGSSNGEFRVYADWTGQSGFLNQADCDALNDVVIAH